MGLSMLFEICGCRKSLSAFGTLERLFTSVDLLVSLQVGNLSKGFVAAWMGTLVWFFSCMDPKMFLQRRILGKRLSTSDRWTYKDFVMRALHFVKSDVGSDL